MIWRLQLSHMFRRVHKLVVVALLILAVGAHWFLIQSAAWAGMLVSYSRGTSFEKAWTKTFSGKYPCQLCQLVKEGKKSEQKREMLKLDLKLEYILVADAAMLHPPRPHGQLKPANEHAASRCEPPPSPPPRFV